MCCAFCSLQEKGAESGDGSLYVTYRNQVILSTMGIPGSLLAGWMVEQPVFGRKGTLAISTGTFYFLCDLRSIVITPQCPSAYRSLPIRKHDFTDIEHAPGLELCLHVREQRYVWCPVRYFARAVPRKGSWNRQCVGCVCEPHFWSHGEQCLLVDELWFD